MATTDKERETSKTPEDKTERGGLRQSTSEAYGAARQRTTAAYDSARERAGNAYASTRRQAAEQIDANPFGMLIGGFAVGALIAGLLPRTERENRTLGAVSSRINDTAKGKLDDLGLNREGINERLNEFARSTSDAFKRAGKSGNGRD